MSAKQKYKKLLEHPLWQRKRLEIMKRDGFMCRWCGNDDQLLHIHHLKYGNGKPWEVPDEWLVAICEDCHWNAHGSPGDPPASPTFLIETPHHYYHFIDGYWLCACGCGSVLTRDEFHPLSLTPPRVP